MVDLGLRQVSLVLFDGFELLDATGPLEVFGQVGDRVGVTLVGPRSGPVASSQGIRLMADVAYAGAPAPDIVLVPGGSGTRALAGDRDWLAWLAAWAGPARLVASVCTGAALLAAAGLLDGHRATTNRRAADWVAGLGPGVTWVQDARWVEDGDRWTSAGVSAGLDMALALTATLWGQAAADAAAAAMEYGWMATPCG
ncbi:MAG: DJ-1/PfpI family protein [Propionibacteriaceae bacterium]|jgi:transcriptional regulator GlxA family with amidase domain|nr:DJ-1/PfpI family protein [Propionibacteriaceae bacterium]